MNRSKAVTIIEIIVVVVIMAIIATLAVSQYSGLTEKNKSKEAISNLELIYHAQKRYYLNHGNQYFACDNDPCTKAEIYANLKVEIPAHYFSYAITPLAVDKLGNPIGFKATARRNTPSACGNRTMSITDQNIEVDRSIKSGGCASW